MMMRGDRENGKSKRGEMKDEMGRGKTKKGKKKGKWIRRGGEGTKINQKPMISNP